MIMMDTVGMWQRVKLCQPSSAMAAVLSIVFLACVGVVFILFKRIAAKRSLEAAGIPTVMYIPRFWQYQVSDTHKLSASNITNILRRMRRLKGPLDVYGTVYGLNTKVVHVAHPQVAQAVLNSSSPGGTPSAARRRRRLSIWQGSGACKAPAYDHFQDFCGRGVFTAEGSDWKAKRAAVMHALLRTQPQGYETQVTEEARRAADQLVEYFQSNGEKSINITPVLQRATIGLIYRYISHSDMSNGLSNGEEEQSLDSDSCSSATPLSSPLSSSFNDGERCINGLLSSYLDAITRIRMIILAQSRSLWFLLPRWFYRRCSSLFQQEQDCMVSINAMARNACQAALPGSPLDVLRQSPLYKTSRDKISQNLLDEAITLLFAGQDTSAATLSWTLHLLSLYPKVQDRLVKEIQEGVKVGKNNITDLPFLDAVVKESMRLYPVAPFVVRRLPNTVSVTKQSKEGVTIPAGSLVCIWIYSLHRNDKYWNHPDSFLPERWLAQGEQRDDGITNGAYMPFCSGPRNCVGQPLAHVVLRVILSKLLQRFEFSDERLSDGVQVESLRHDMQAGFTILPLGGVHLSLRERK